MNDKEKLLRDYGRMCKNACDTGSRCEIATMAVGYDCTECQMWIADHPKEAIKAIEKWGADHPIKTRQSEFLKLHPNAESDSDGVLEIAPCVIDSTLRFFQDGICIRGNNCIKCAQEYWSQEV